MRRTGSSSSEILLDKSYHYSAMKILPNNNKRGRPDIVHFALMEALSTPLFFKSMLRVYVHTVNDMIIRVADNLRIPKSYFRFEGLMVKLFKEGVVKSDGGERLMEMSRGTIADVLGLIKPEKVIGLSAAGVSSSPQAVARNITSTDNSVFVVGGFPKGHFAESTARHLGSVYSVGDIGLESHVVISRLIYECEKFRFGSLEEGINHERDKERRQVRA